MISFMLRVLSNNDIKTIINNSLSLSKNPDWIEDVFYIIKNYIIDNQRIIYGGYALLLNIQRKDKAIKLDLNDIDVYSQSPIDDMNNIINLIAKKDYCYKTRITRAKHFNTYTLFVNDKKVLDISYLSFSNESFGFHKSLLGNRKYILYVRAHILFIDYFSMISDKSSVWMIEKAINKINQLQNYYPFVNPSINQKINDMISEFSEDNYNIINKIKAIFLHKPDIKSEYDNKYIKIYSNNLPITYKYYFREPNYFFSGFFAYNEFIKILNNTDSLDIINKIDYLDIYVYNSNYYLSLILKELDKLNIKNVSVIDKDGWPNHFDKEIRIKINNKRIVSLYEISKERTYKTSGDKFNFSSFYFLLSFLLLQSNVRNRDNMNIFNKCIYNLLYFKEKNKNNPEFNNNIFESIIGNTIGCSEDILVSNSIYISKLNDFNNDKSKK